MRRVDQYPLIGAYIFATSIDIKEDSQEPNIKSVIKDESRNWSLEIKNVAKMTADAMNFLLIDYSILTRAIYFIYRINDPKLTPIDMLLKRTDRKSTRLNSSH